MTFDGTYYYTFDDNGNRAAKFKSETGVLDDTATDITLYTWDNRNRMTTLTHKASLDAEADLVIDYSYDIENRMVEEDEVVGGSLDERMIYDGSQLLEVLNSDNSVLERYLNGAAVDQVFAIEEAAVSGYSGGSGGLGDSTYSGVNWLLADMQGTVRDVARGVVSGGATSTSIVDHVFFDAYGVQPAAQTATVAQLQTRIGFQGMMIDPLVGFPAANGASGLYYSVGQGFYDAGLGTYLTAAQQGYNSSVANPFEFSSDNPVSTGYGGPVMPVSFNSVAGIMNGGSGGSGGSGTAVFGNNWGSFGGGNSGGDATGSGGEPRRD